jgi:hypothetical protein
MRRIRFGGHEIEVHRQRSRWVASIDGKELVVPFDTRGDAEGAAIVKVVLDSKVEPAGGRRRRGAPAPGSARRSPPPSRDLLVLPSPRGARPVA